MNAYLPGMEGERRLVERSQWFTDPVTAQRIVDFALRPFSGEVYNNGLPFVRDVRVLEPSAGRGALVKALRIAGVGHLDCVEIDEHNVTELVRQGFGVLHADFLETIPPARNYYDLVVMNPPFEGNQLEDHVMHALRWAPRVVCHGPLTTLAGVGRGARMWPKVDMPRLAICSSRPKYGDKGGMTDMCTMELTARTSSTPAIAPTLIEWWP